MVDEHRKALGGQRRAEGEARQQALVLCLDLLVENLGLSAHAVRPRVDDGVKFCVLWVATSARRDRKRRKRQSVNENRWNDALRSGRSGRTSNAWLNGKLMSSQEMHGPIDKASLSTMWASHCRMASIR
jgi:hypothetical protein